jgi:hypothetical protein
MKTAGAAAAIVTPLLLLAQAAGPLSVAPIPMTSARRGAALDVALTAQLRAGYHTNSNKPSESYLIPLKLDWDVKAAPLDVIEVVYPQPRMEKYEFSDKPLSVYSGDFKIQTRFRAKADAPLGPAQIAGKLRYQACTDKDCLPPRTVPVSFTLNVK